MVIVELPQTHPLCFGVIAVLWTAVQGLAGWNYGLFINETSSAPRTDWRRHAVYGLHHACQYVACSVAGFASWQKVSELLAPQDSLLAVTAPGATLTLALGAVTVLGVSGALARLLYLGQRLW